MQTSLPKKTFAQYRESSIPLGDLLEFQDKSYSKFLAKDLNGLFKEFFPIVDSKNRFIISYISHVLDTPKATPHEAKKNFGNYTSCLRVRLKLENTVTGVIKEEEVYLGEVPIMTPQHTFIIRGIERTIISQLVKVTGVRFYDEVRGRSARTFGAKVSTMKNRGVWVTFESDATGKLFVRIDQGMKKMPVTTFIRAFGPDTKEGVLRLFRDDERALAAIKNTFTVDEANIMDEVWTSFYKVLRIGSPSNPEKAKEIVMKKFSPDWYDIGEIGRVNFNKRFGLPTDAAARKIRHLTLEDIVLIAKEIVRLNNMPEAVADDIDHLSLRRVRTVGELVYDEARKGFARIRKNALDRMVNLDPKLLELPTNVLSLKTFQNTVHGFFNVNELSQPLKQQNILQEVEHLRTVSALGAGGVKRERAGASVRDLHPTHYGRICPIHSPEGENIGLVLHFALYARINEFGLLECPYLRVRDGKVTDEIEYLPAVEEERYRIVGASTPVKDGVIVTDKKILTRHNRQTERVSADKVDFIDVSTAQIFSMAAALVPFASNTLPTRSATGARMQGQAIPCLNPEPPLVATGYEEAVARASNRLIFAEESGVVESVDAKHVTVKGSKGIKRYEMDTFPLAKAHTFANHQRPAVNVGDKVKKGQVLVDVASTSNGQLALGKNLRVAFIPYEGGTFEDAIIISERLVRDEVLTSVEVREYVVDVRDTKLGPDTTTADIPNVAEKKLRNLGADGIINVGSSVVPGDILVGKLTPRGESQLTAEERLLQSIFGEKAKEMRDTSKVLPPGEKGKVVSVQVRSRDSGDDVDNGVIKQIRIVIGGLRHIRVGDKLANRYGNKGVVSRVAPIEDMPFTKDGEPIDIILSPLGVPSRKNLGQILEMHMGLAAQALNYQAIIPPMTSVSEEELREELKAAGYPDTGRIELFNGKNGQKFSNDCSIGWIYTMKLEHMVEDKIQARSTGKYSLITQQPPGGKKRFGGGRLGEMEVWALIGHGASYTLREMLTIKSDDLQGRTSAYNSIIKNRPITQAGTPAAFNVLLYHLRGLGLNVKLRSPEQDMGVRRTVKSRAGRPRKSAATRAK